jgi:hypothetical protein
VTHKPEGVQFQVKCCSFIEILWHFPAPKFCVFLHIDLLRFNILRISKLANVVTYLQLVIISYFSLIYLSFLQFIIAIEIHSL